MNESDTVLSRRNLLKKSVLSVGLAGGLSVDIAKGSQKKIPVIAFAKAMQCMSYERTASIARSMGWDGLEVPLRPGGQILPERVEEDLPRYVRSMRKEGLEVLTAVTAISEADAKAEKILRACKREGINFYRMGYYKYEKGRSIKDTLSEAGKKLAGLFELNKSIGICGLYQNHSRPYFVGSPVWDICELLERFDKRYLAMQFDIGHATVEGGYNWALHYERARDVMGSVVVKDFYWEKSAGGKWQARWCPLGEGMVRGEFFDKLKEDGFAGPLSMHFEYPEGFISESRNNAEEALEYMRKDTKALGEYLK